MINRHQNTSQFSIIVDSVCELIYSFQLASLLKHSRLFCCSVKQAIPFVPAEWRDVQTSSMWEHPFLQPVFTIFSQFFKEVPFMSQWMTNCLDSIPMQARLDARGKLSSRDSLSHVLLKTQGRSWCSHLFHKQQGERHIYSILSVNPSTVLQCYTTLPFPAWQAAALRRDFLSRHTSSLSLKKGHRLPEGEWQHSGTAAEILSMQKPSKHSCSLITCFSATALLIIRPSAWSWTRQ